MAPCVYALQVYDFGSDIWLSYEMMEAAMAAGEGVSSALFLVAVGSELFILVPFVLNLWYAARIRKQQSVQQSASARVWFNSNFRMFIFLFVWTGSCFPVLQLVNSQLFNRAELNAGLLPCELRELRYIGVYCTVVAENIPQILLQLLFTLYTYDTDGVSSVTVAAFIASTLSVLAALVTFCSERRGDDYEVAKYFLLFSSDRRHAISDAKFGLRWALLKKLTTAMDIEPREIEIGTVRAVDGEIGDVKVHVQHLVFSQTVDEYKRKLNLPYRYVVSPSEIVQHQFDEKRSQIGEALCEHFEIEDSERSAFHVAMLMNQSGEATEDQAVGGVVELE